MAGGLRKPAHYQDALVYNCQTSTLKNITASVIQGPSIGPVACVVTAGDLRVADPGNRIVKFADDIYLVIPASGIYTRKMKLDNFETWAQSDHKLN